MRWFAVPSACLVASFLLGAGTPAGAQEASENLDLLATINSFYTSIDSADVDTRIDLLAEDVVMMPNHWTMTRGKEEVAAIFRRSAEAVFLLRDRDLIAMDVSGDIAYTVNSYYYTYHARDSDPQWHKTKNVHVWKRDAGGSWKLAVDIWNSDVTLEQFTAE